MVGAIAVTPAPFWRHQIDAIPPATVNVAADAAIDPALPPVSARLLITESVAYTMTSPVPDATALRDRIPDAGFSPLNGLTLVKLR